MRTDDDVALAPEVTGRAAARPEALAPSPATDVGLTPADVDRVEGSLRR